MTSLASKLLVLGFSKLGLSSTMQGRQIHTQACPSMFKVTSILSAEPMKKKKKIDPAVLRMREDRRKRKVEKQIKKLEKVGQKFKPIEELEVPPKLLQEKKLRQRPLPKIDEDSRVALSKEWSKYKYQQHCAEAAMIHRMMECQNLALNELKMENLELYEECLQPDLTIIPFAVVGPVNTPPIESYVTLDGDYQDITKKWE